MSTKKILGIDPGLKGAIVLFDGENFASYAMPVRKIGKSSEIVFRQVRHLLASILKNSGRADVFLERAVSFGMGSTSAFNYGRGFAALEIALQSLQVPVTYVEPGKWTKEMHQGIPKDLKPKAKSLVAVERLYPHLLKQIPKNRNGRLDEGCVDALLIAGYGHRILTGGRKEMPDFY